MSEENSFNSERLDNLFNAISGLGSSRDKTTYVDVGSGIELTQEKLETLYRFNHFAARIVDKLPDDCTRRGWHVMVPSRSDDPFIDAFNDLGLINKMKDADKWARLYGGAGIVLGVKDGKAPDQPVDLENVESIEYATVFDRYEIYPIEFQEDWREPNFGEPKIYQLTPRTYTTGAPQTKVHADRVLPFYGVKLPENLAARNQYWGDSVLLRAFDPLKKYITAEQAAIVLVQEFSLALWKINGLAAILAGPDGKEKLLERVMLGAMSKSVVNAMVLDADGEDFDKVTGHVAGVPELLDKFGRSFAAAAEMPITMLFGEPPGGLSTDDRSGRTYWYNVVGARQVSTYLEPIMTVIKYLAAADSINIEGLEIDFLPLDQPTEEQAVEMRYKQAQTDDIYLEHGVVTPKEVRMSRYGGTYSIETALIEEEWDDDKEDPPSPIELMMAMQQGQQQEEGQEPPAQPQPPTEEPPEDEPEE